MKHAPPQYLHYTGIAPIEFIRLVPVINKRNRVESRSVCELSSALWDAAHLHANPDLAPTLSKAAIVKAGRLVCKAARNSGVYKKTLNHIDKWMAKMPDRKISERNRLIAAFQSFGLEHPWSPPASFIVIPSKTKALSSGQKLDHAIWTTAKRHSLSHPPATKEPRFRDGV